MRWLKPNLRGSLFGWLGSSGPPTPSTLESRTEAIRQSMLELLGDDGTRRFPVLVRRIRYAGDVHALWYLRGDLMAALAALGSERAAREQMAELTDQFRGLLPAGLTSRPASL